MLSMPYSRLSTTSYALLGLLMFAGRTDERLTGYELKQRADRTLRFYWTSPAMSQVYSELAKLDAHGLVEGRTEEGPRPATSYQITPIGQQVLRGWLADSPVSFPLLRHPVALRLLMGDLNTPEGLHELLEGYREALVRRTADLGGVRAMLGDDPHLRYPAMVADWGLAYYASEDAIVAGLQERLAGRAADAVATGSGGTHPVARLGAVALDCPDPLALARFYARLVGGEIVAEEPDWVELRGGSCTLAFQLAPDHVPPTWPDGGIPQQAHLDLVVDDMDAAEAVALEAGARPTGLPGPGGGSWRVYLDPAGHPFCFVHG